MAEVITTGKPSPRLESSLNKLGAKLGKPVTAAIQRDGAKSLSLGAKGMLARKG